MFYSVSTCSKYHQRDKVCSDCCPKNNYVWLVKHMLNYADWSCVIYDSNLGFRIMSQSFFCLQNISKVHSIRPFKDTKVILHAFISSCLWSLLTGLSQQSIHRLQIVQNSLVRLLTKTKRSDHVTPAFTGSLHVLGLILLLTLPFVAFPWAIYLTC